MHLGFKGTIIILCVGIYAVLVGEMVVADGLHSDFLPCGYTVILCFSCSELSALAKSIFNAHINTTQAGKSTQKGFLGVCTCRQRLNPKGQNKSRFQSDKAANPLFSVALLIGLPLSLLTQRQRRDEPCGNGNDCRHASCFLVYHV